MISGYARALRWGAIKDCTGDSGRRAAGETHFSLAISAPVGGKNRITKSDRKGEKFKPMANTPDDVKVVQFFLVAYPDKAVPGAFDYPLQAGMVLCVEASVGEVDGGFLITLEDHVLVTEGGFENLTRSEFNPPLMGR